MVTYTRWLSSVLIGVFILVVMVSSAYADRCPRAENNKQDGFVDEGKNHFTYESWVKEAEHDGERYYQFGRCIQNRGNDEVWTHWKGILADSWIPVNDRLMRLLKRTSESSEEKDKQLWYGDGRDYVVVVETTCWENEKPCESPESDAVDPTAEDDPHASGNDDTSSEDSSIREQADEQTIRQVFESGRDFSGFDYGEVFLPTNQDDLLASLVRVGIELVTAIDRENADTMKYSIAIYFRNEDRRRLQIFAQDSAHEYLATLSFSNHILQAAFSDDLVIDKDMVLRYGRELIVFDGKSLEGRIENVVFDSSSIEIKNFAGEVESRMPVSFYTFKPW